MAGGKEGSNRGELAATSRSRFGCTGGTGTAAVSIVGLHHITVLCSDADRTETYYSNVLGFSVVARTSEPELGDSQHLYFAVGNGTAGGVVSFIEQRGMPPG